MGYHVVGAQETIRTLSVAYGVPVSAIWDDPHNAGLRQTRQVNVLLEGDRVWIPDPGEPLTAISPEGYPVRTGRTYGFGGVQLQETAVRFRNSDNSPRANWHYRYDYEGTRTGTLDAHGEIVFSLPEWTRSIVLLIWPPHSSEEWGEQFTLLIGALDPVRTSSGVEHRFTNLGIQAPSTDAGHAAQVRRFQAREMPEHQTGEFDDDTRRALQHKHGS